MKDIKEKNKIKIGIKSLDKNAIASQRFKNNITDIKNKVDNDENNNNEYGNKKIENSTKYLSNKFVNSFVKKSNNLSYKNVKKIINTKDNLKIGNKSVKTIKNTNKLIDKTIKDTSKASQKLFKATEKTIQATIKTVKTGVKISEKIIKAIIDGIKSLIELIASGGWFAVVVIIIICMIAFLLCSVFGIFFSNEINSTRPMTSVISEVNLDINNKINNIKSVTVYDDFIIESSFTNWKEVIAIYSVKYSSGDNMSYYLDANNIMYLKQVFWEMNNIKTYLQREATDNPLIFKNTLYITLESKSKDQVMEYYGFTEEMKEKVNFLLESKNDSLWDNLIYGSSSRRNFVVDIALKEVDNVGGEKFWRWYGFDSRVEWCAVFVSWVANEAGVLDKNIPRFSVVDDGINWFKSRGRWQEKNYSPKPGDIIFFDWENDGKPNHVGIVEKVEDDIIYTIEGNSTNDECCQKKYDLFSNFIFGFGIL